LAPVSIRLEERIQIGSRHTSFGSEANQVGGENGILRFYDQMSLARCCTSTGKENVIRGKGVIPWFRAFAIWHRIPFDFGILKIGNAD